jgi:RNA polymerase sigma factor (sigma-70 family)
MASGLDKVVEHLQQAFPPGVDLTDAQLLGRFIAARDEAAFAALVRRHGPMVLGLCRRLLRHAHDAEDCFQATFLVLARKAAVVRRGAVAGFLYAVAYRTALEARAQSARRRARERQVQDMPHPEVRPAEVEDWRPLLDRELSRLREDQRAVIVLCDLEGRPRKEAARLLGLPEGTLSSRLARARQVLARRLASQGVALPAGALALVMAEVSSAAVSAPLILATVRAAVLVAGGKAAAVTTPAAALMKEVLKAMLLTKLKMAVAMVFVAGALGAGGLVYRAAAETPAEKRPPADPEAQRRENELLKLNLEVVLEKVRAQQAELHSLKDRLAAAQQPNRYATILNQNQWAPLPYATYNTNAANFTPWIYDAQYNAQPAVNWIELFNSNPNVRNQADVPRRAKVNVPDPVKEVEDALNGYRGARDKDAKQRAAEKLANAAARLKERLK